VDNLQSPISDLQSKIQNSLRELPSVDRLLNSPAAIDLIEQYGRPLTVEALRTTLEARRIAILNGTAGAPMNALLLQEAHQWLEQLVTPTIRPVINATGVIIHTNLGRAPLSQAAIEAMQATAAAYTTLEYDLASGERGSRAVHAEGLLTRLVAAEAALVVNNNAAAVLLMLTALCQGREVIISRGQLVEIGGGFRVPDVMAQSGARLVEVGTTNRTHLRDYAAAINENTAALLVAHHSNFKIVGFTSEPTLAELAELAHEHGLPLLYDQGSGALLDTTAYGLDPEPTVPSALHVGADVVSFSGDKLLGGPQAGILCGRAELIGHLKRHPLARAVRADKLCLAGLSATLTHYLTSQATKEIPVWRMIARRPADIKTEAESWAAELQQQGIPATVIEGLSTVGGGSLPGSTLPTSLVALEHPNLEGLSAALRQSDPPIIGRIADGRFLLDPRTVLPGQAQPLLRTLLQTMLTNGKRPSRIP
jgi:L-seryl-tRNA(Ser) seleniumtransferase